MQQYQDKVYSKPGSDKMSGFTMSDDDVIVDSVPEDYPESDDNQRPAAPRQRPPENPENDVCQLLGDMKSLDVSGEKKTACSQSDHPMEDFYFDDYTQMNHWFPPNLKEKLNIAIIHADEDKDEADNMREYIKKNVFLEIDKKLFRPRVDLLENVAQVMNDDVLDIALREADFLFVYVTRNFDQCEWSKYQSISSVKAIVSGGKPCSLICVHTEQSSGVNLPAKLKNAKRLNYYQGEQEKFKDNVIANFHLISHKLLADRCKLIENRKLYSNKLPVNPESSSSKPGKFSQRESKEKQVSPSNDVALDSGAVGDSGSRKPMNAQPHHRTEKKVSQDFS